MFSLLKHLKSLNRQRISNRRNAVFQNEFSNEFDRSALQLDTLKFLIAKTDSFPERLKATKKFAVYSTFFGTSHTKTFNTTQIDPQYDHFFISNNENVLALAKARGWIPIFLQLNISTNRVLSAQQSKVPKALPHLFPALKHYDFLFYVDDKIAFNANKIYLLKDLLIHGQNYAVLIREHPSLTNNILNEFAAAMIQPRYQSQRDQVVAYIDKQIKSGLKLQVDRLFWTSAILRNMNHADTRLINENWYEAIIDCGIECQVSFDFIAQRYSSIAVLPQIII